MAKKGETDAAREQRIGNGWAHVLAKRGRGFHTVAGALVESERSLRGLVLSVSSQLSTGNGATRQRPSR